MRKVLLLFVLMASLSCSSPASPWGRSKECIIEPADSVVMMLGDSVSNVIFRASDVNLYSVVEKEDTTMLTTEFVFKSIRQVLIEKTDSVVCTIDSLICDSITFSKPEKLSKGYKSIIQFLLSDDRMYMKGNNYPSAPFIPEYMMQFSTKEHSVQLLISLSGGFFKVYYECAYVKTIKYLHEHEMLYFLSLVSDEESLKELLKLQMFN